MRYMKKAFPLYIVALFLFMLTPFLFAAGGTGSAVIQQVSINQGRILVYGNFSGGNPDSCDKSSPQILFPDRPDYSETYALLVASFLQGKPVSLYLNGCREALGYTHPNITVVTGYRK